MTTRILVGHVLDQPQRKSNGQFRPGTHWRPRKPHWGRQWLIREYVIKGRSCSEIAAAVGCKENNIHFWLKKHGIPARSTSEARALKHWGPAGEENPMYGRRAEAAPAYRSGSTPERQRDYGRTEWRSFVAAIFRRDDYRCQRCGSGKSDRGSLHAHHLAAYSQRPDLRRDPSNVVTLCRACHRWVHSKKNEAGEYLR